MKTSFFQTVPLEDLDSKNLFQLIEFHEIFNKIFDLEKYKEMILEVKYHNYNDILLFKLNDKNFEIRYNIIPKPGMKYCVKAYLKDFEDQEFTIIFGSKKTTEFYQKEIISKCLESYLQQKCRSIE